MAKLQKPFEFDFPLQNRTIRGNKIVKETIGTLRIEGIVYFNPDASVLDMSERFSCDIDFIRWNGTDIKPVLEVVADITVDEIQEAVCRMAAKELFTQKSVA